MKYTDQDIHIAKTDLTSNYSEHDIQLLMAFYHTDSIDILTQRILDAATVTAQMPAVCQGHDPKQIKADIHELVKALAPQVTIEFDANGNFVSEHKVESIEDFPVIDTIIVLGSNDLYQVDNAIRVWEQLPNRDAITFWVSGYGGHGTVPGPIFSKSEAETMADHLQRYGGVAAKQIQVEPKSTNTGQNVEFINDMMGAQGYQPVNALVFGTPASAMRQVRTIEKQSPEKRVPISYRTLTIFPEQDQSGYYRNDNDLCIILYGFLREVASYVNYTANSPFLPIRPVSNGEAMKQAIEIAFRYAKPSTAVNSAALAAEYVAGLESGDLSEVKTKYGDAIKDLSTILRGSFAELEREYMPRLPEGLTLDEQAAVIAKLRP